MRRRQLFQLAGATLVAACGVLPVAPITLQIVTAPPYIQHTILEVVLTLRRGAVWHHPVTGACVLVSRF